MSEFWLLDCFGNISLLLTFEKKIILEGNECVDGFCFYFRMCTFQIMAITNFPLVVLGAMPSAVETLDFISPPQLQRETLSQWVGKWANVRVQILASPCDPSKCLPEQVSLHVNEMIRYSFLKCLRKYYFFGYRYFESLVNKWCWVKEDMAVDT